MSTHLLTVVGWALAIVLFDCVKDFWAQGKQVKAAVCSLMAVAALYVATPQPLVVNIEAPAASPQKFKL